MSMVPLCAELTTLGCRGGIGGARDRAGTVGFGTALRVRAFTVLYVAETQSMAGDQLARVAVSVLVFQRTASAAATAVTYALTYLPAVIGGLFLAGLGDRWPRRAVMIGTDTIRAGLFGLMALPDLPLPVLIGLLVTAVFISPVFSACEVSYLAVVLRPDVFRVANGLRLISVQGAQVAGFALGGILVAAVEPRGALLVNAATFAVSAVLLTVLLPRSDRATTPAPDGDQEGTGTEDFRGLWRDRGTRRLMSLLTLVGFFVVAEGLAVPFGQQIGATTTQTGLLLAALPLGSALGAIAIVRISPSVRSRLVGPMTVLCGVPLVASAALPQWEIAWLLWALSGAFAAYQVDVITSLVRAIPDRVRSQTTGIVGAWLLGAQGLGIVLGGLIARGAGAGAAIAVTGVLGIAVAAAVAVAPGMHVRVVAPHSNTASE